MSARYEDFVRASLSDLAARADEPYETFTAGWPQVEHEVGAHYVVRVRAKRPGKPDLYCVRRVGIVQDRTLARLSGATARADAIALADRLAVEAGGRPA